jgi:TPR repeat protein
MNRTFKAAAAFVLAVGFTCSAAAGPYEDALAAYRKGDYGTVLRLMRPLADRGEAHAQSVIGAMYAEGQDYAAALSWYRKAADQGYAYAQDEVGRMFANGMGVRQDYAAAMSWYRKAASRVTPKLNTILGSFTTTARASHETMRLR